jgi:hypothetical protein
MNKQHDQTADNVREQAGERAKKKPYVRPVLVRHGDVDSLTQSIGRPITSAPLELRD